jgi:hypothetical protein
MRPGIEHRKVPFAQRRVAGTGVAFFCFLFLARQEKEVARRGEYPASGTRNRSGSHRHRTA